MDIPTYYRIVDPVPNLKVRVELKCITEPKRKNKKNDDEDEIYGNNKVEEEDDSSDSEGEDKTKRTIQGKTWTRSFSWQEKTFGPREILRYRPGGIDGEEGNDDDILGRTAVEMEYRQELSNRVNEGFNILKTVDKVMLFTYTDKDGFVPQNELQRFVTTSEDFITNPVADSIVRLPQRGDHKTDTRYKKIPLGDDTDIIDGDRRLDGSLNGLGIRLPFGDMATDSAGERLFRESTFKVFYIMAAVDVNLEYFSNTAGRKSKNPSFHEVVLCRITVDKDGNQIEFKPALSSANMFLKDEDDSSKEAANNPNLNVYRFRTPKGGVYEFTIINEAESTGLKLENEFRSYQKEYDRRAKEALENRVEKGLIGMPKSSIQCRYHVFFEIVSVSNFDPLSKNVYVQYEACLPKNKFWKWESSSCPGFPRTQNDDPDNMCNYDSNLVLKGVTQTTCLKTTSTGGTMGNYCFPIEFEMTHSIGSEIENEEEGVLLESIAHKPCQIFLQVKSRDMWERHRTEGYAYVQIPMEPGTYDMTLKSWKVSGTSRQKVSEYFVGGALQLDSSSYTAIPQTVNGTFLNRYGFSSETSGDVRVRLNVVKQMHVNEQAKEDIRTSIKENKPLNIISEESSRATAARPRVRTVEEIISSLKYGTRKQLSTHNKSDDIVSSLNRLRAQKQQDDQGSFSRTTQDDLELEKEEESNNRAQIQARLEQMKARMKRNKASPQPTGNDIETLDEEDL